MRRNPEVRRPVWPVPVAVFGVMLLAWGLLMADAAGIGTPADFGPRTIAVPQAAGPAPAEGDAVPADRGAGRRGGIAPPPAELRLPSRDLAAPVRPVGVTTDGTLQLPADPGEVGWWAGGAGAGAASGAAVVAGHVRTVAGGSGVLAALLDVSEGETVDLVRADGEVVPYRVRSRLSYVKEELPAELFTGGGPHRLVLVTCTGDVDPETGSYTRNVVVTAEPAA
ncbi:MAG: class F sortase [Kineosporiaceae bacterium]